MKSLQITKFGKIEDVTKLVESDIPELKPTQVIVELLASPINPSDVLLIKGAYPRKVEFPHTMGNEGIGRVTKLGSEVSSLKEGQVVLLPGGTSCWQSHFILEAKKLTPIPIEDKDTILQLAMVGINPPTAYLMLQDFVKLQAGDWIIQNAANSAVGRYIIQLAKNMGVKTINVVRRAELKEELEALGADVVLVDDERIYRQVREIVGDGKVKLGIDAVAGDATTRMIRCLSKGATVVVYGSMSLEPIKVNVGIMLTKDPVIKSFWLSTWYQKTNQKEIMGLLQKLVMMILQGKLKTKIVKTFKLEEYNKALNYADQEAKGGKVLFSNF